MKSNGVPGSPSSPRVVVRRLKPYERVLEDFGVAKKSLFRIRVLCAAVLLQRVDQSRAWHLRCDQVVLHEAQLAASEASDSEISG